MAPKLREIAARILAHLQRIEADPALNPDTTGKGLHRYYHAYAFVGGNRIGVTYIRYQGASYLTKAEALAYLAWLDAGNVGTHRSVITP